MIVPTRDRPTAMGRCLDALARCTPPPGGFEVVVAAASPEACPDAGGRGISVRVLDGPDRGRPDARNQAVAASRGRLLAFTDDDCVPDEAWLVELVTALGRRPDALAGGRIVNGLPRNTWAEAAQVALNVAYEHFERNPGDRAAFFGTNNLAMARATFDAVGGFDEALVHAAEDRDLCDRMRRSGHPLVHAPRAVVVHEHDLSLRGLVRQQASYGRGGATLRRQRAAQGLPPLVISPGFFGALLGEPLRRRRPGLLAAVVFSQVAYAGGMLREEWALRRSGRA